MINVYMHALSIRQNYNNSCKTLIIWVHDFLIFLNSHDYTHAKKHNILEVSNNRDPCNKGTILSHPDAPELSPPLEPDSQDTDTPLVY